MHVIILIEHLALNPHSRVFAIRGGTPELQGWDATTVINARTHNLIAALIGGLGGQDMTDMLIDYPGSKNVEPEPQNLAEFIRRHVDGGGLNDFLYT